MDQQTSFGFARRKTSDEINLVVLLLASRLAALGRAMVPRGRKPLCGPQTNFDFYVINGVTLEEVASDSPKVRWRRCNGRTARCRKRVFCGPAKKVYCGECAAEKKEWDWRPCLGGCRDRRTGKIKLIWTTPHKRKCENCRRHVCEDADVDEYEVHL